MIHLLPEFVLAEGMRYGSATVAVPTDRDGVQQDLEKITGSWVLVYWLFDGEEQSLAEGRPVMTFAAERFTIRRGGRVIEKGHIEVLAPQRRPKPYEYAPTEVNGRPQALKYPGIYLLEDDLFIACIGYQGARPEAFSSMAGSRTELVVYTRVKSAGV
jgi:uncharacterized protein (TIGR03067 family)